MEPLAYVALLGGGLIAGVINSVAGGGSLITLPLLVFAGLPPTVANATNRVAVAVQSLAGVIGFGGWPFRRAAGDDPSEGRADPGGRVSHLPWRVVGRTVGPTLAGSLAGAVLAARISDELFRPIMAVVLLLMAAVVALKPGRWLPSPSGSSRPMSGGLLIAFFMVGVYGGFIQAGVGFMLLAALVPGLGLDLVRANGVKVALVLALTLVALIVFVSAGQVDWRAGGVLALGNGAGGYLGARLAVRLGAGWVRWILLVMVALFALELLNVRALVTG